jgi:hypothetical protein
MQAGFLGVFFPSERQRLSDLFAFRQTLIEKARKDGAQDKDDSLVTS